MDNSLNLISSFEPYIVPLIGLLVSSIYFRVLLQIFGQSWIKTIAHTATLTLLPILTFIITNLISGNIALSLGMVGALSIVRFRNPVRSPLELSVYFGAITMGIAAAVNVKWLIFMVGSLTLAPMALLVIHLLCVHILKSPFFITSFSEGNSLSTLKILSTKSQQKINDSKLLISKSVTSEEITYVLASPNFDILKNIEKDLIKFDGVFSTHLNQ